MVSSMANLGRLLIPLLLPLLIWVRLDDHHDDGEEEDGGGDEDVLHLPFLRHLLLVLLLVGLTCYCNCLGTVLNNAFGSKS